MAYDFLLNLLFFPLLKGQYEVQILSMWKVSDIGQAVGAVVADLLQFLLVLVRAYDHDVRPDVKVFAGTISAFIRNPCAHIHVSNSHRMDVRLAPGQTLLDPFHENRIETHGVVLRVDRHTEQTG